MRKAVTNLAYFAALALYSPVVVYRMIRHRRYRDGWPQRRGYIDRPNPQKPCLWIHAVSVGEVNATRTIIPALRQQFPDYEILLTATTDTGLARARALYERIITVSYFPFDVSWIMERAFDRIRPAAVLLLELEVWPNLARIAAERNIPVIVVNGRISDRSFPKYLKIKGLIASTFRRVTLVLAQTQEYADRFIALGCPPDCVRVTGSLKYDTAQTDGPVEGADRLREQIRREDEPLWVAGGTGPGEEQILLDIYGRLRKEFGLQNLRLALIPRKPERFDETAQLIEKAGFAYVRYSRLKGEDRPCQTKPPVILGDTMGDLRKFYALADIVFVGRTLTPMGGSDMMEPAGLGKCTLFGPHTFNFRQTVEVLLGGRGAIEVQDEHDLETHVRQLLLNKELADQTAQNGRRIILDNKGTTGKMVEELKKILQKQS